MEPVLEEIEKQQEYFEQAEDYDCAEAVMSAKWAVINAKEVEAIPIEWLLKKKASCIHMSNRASQTAWLIDDLIKEWQKDQAVETR